MHSILNFIDGSVLSVGLCFAFFFGSLLFYCSCIQLAIYLSTSCRGCCLMPYAFLWISFAPKIQGWFVIFISSQSWFLIYTLYVFCDGALMSKKSCTQRSVMFFQSQRNLEQQLYHFKVVLLLRFTVYYHSHWLFLFLFVYHLLLDFLGYSRGNLQEMGYPLSCSLLLCTLDVILGVCVIFPYDFLCRVWILMVLVPGQFVVISIDGREK